MRKSILSLAALTMLSATTSAQQVEAEVAMGASYANNVFLNLETQDEHVVANNVWDLAFYRDNAYDQGVKVNDAKGWTLYEVGQISSYETIDLTNEASWEQLHNPSTDYTKGAFNVGSAEYGWGAYNPLNHHTTGTLAFVMKNGEEDYVKIKIEDYFGAYTFTYAEWDGTVWGDDVEATVANGNADNYFNFFAFDTQGVVEVEPGKAEWDLLFIKYTDTYVHGGMTTPNQVVTGVLSNPNIKIARTTEAEANVADLSGDMNVIGAADWKFLDGWSWGVDSDINYFIKRNNEDTVYKVNFTEFEGSSTGIVRFTIDNQATLSVEQVAEGVSFNVYPNPTTDKRIQVVYDITATNANQNQITIYALNGAIVHKAAAESHTGFYTQTLDLSQLTAGVYILEFKSGNQASTKKIVLK